MMDFVLVEVNLSKLESMRVSILVLVLKVMMILTLF